MEDILQNLKENRYGSTESKEDYNLHEWIYGHRLMGGQTWIEYFLEFLNVLKGFNYELTLNSDKKYSIERKLGFRRFLFVPLYPKDTEVGKKNFADKCAYELLIKKLKKEIDENKLKDFHSFLETFIPKDVATSRSWFAKFLFPLHESTLFFEVRRKSSENIETCKNLEENQEILINIDNNFDKPRNFFARGGELYYLMLLQGKKEGNIKVETSIQNLLTNKYQDIGKSIDYIEKKWQEIKNMSNENNKIEEKKQETIEIGWITHPNCKYYEIVYTDLENILKNNIDNLELLNLIAFNIAFNIIMYIYRKSHKNCNFYTCPLENKNQIYKCAPNIFIDAYDLYTNKETRYISVNNLKSNEKQIEKKLDSFFEEIFDFMIKKAENLNKNDDLKELMEKNDVETMDSFVLKVFFEFFNMDKKKIEKYKKNGHLNLEKIKESKKEIYEDILKYFYKHFLPIHRITSKQIGFVQPRTGKNARYVLNEHLIKMLICSTINPSEELEFKQFLQLLYKKYGLIIGLNEAEQANIIKQFNTNRSTFIKNEEKFKEKLRNAGFLVEYSDATVLVKNPFDPIY